MESEKEIESMEEKEDPKEESKTVNQNAEIVEQERNIPQGKDEEKVESSEEPLSAMSMVDELVNEALPSYFGGAGGEHNQLSDSNADLASYGYSHNGSFHEFHYHFTFAFKACRKKNSSNETNTYGFL